MKVIKFVLLLLLNSIVGMAICNSAGVSAWIGGVCLPVISLASPLFEIEGLRAGIYTEVWTGEMIKAFRKSAESLGWLSKIKSYDQYVENDVIHFVNLGGDPTVLINNTTYPLGIENLTDADKAVTLDKYQTKATRITDDEVYAISYDKMGGVLERHREALDEKKYNKALHALAPAKHETQTPVLLTTGAARTDGTGKKILREDIIKLKSTFDAMKVPTQGRILVLCNDHVNDLLESDQKFAEQYYNYSSGKISNLYGFEVYEYQDSPYFTQAKVKVAFGSTPATTDRSASVAFYAPRMMKATGSTKAYLSEAKDDPANQENLVNFRHYFICLPLKNEAIGAIVTAASSS
jgi:hypothetical protein